jgi:tetratricopeptide (TPR) repeat protein
MTSAFRGFQPSHPYRQHSVFASLAITTLVLFCLAPSANPQGGAVFSDRAADRFAATYPIPVQTLSVQSGSSPTYPAAPSAAAESPLPALTSEEQGDLHMAHRRYQAAIVAYRQAPLTSPTIWNKIGLANQQMQGLAEAKKSYETALKLDPKNSDALNNLASIYYSDKDFRTAEHFYRAALKFNPRSALIYKNLGTAMLAENKFKKGWECYRQAMAIDPQIFERQNPLKIGEPTPTRQRGAMNYYLASCYVHANLYDLAVGYLRLAMNQGFTDSRKLFADKDFYPLHGLPAFDQLLADQRAQPLTASVKSEGTATLQR